MSIVLNKSSVLSFITFLLLSINFSFSPCSSCNEVIFLLYKKG